MKTLSCRSPELVAYYKFDQGEPAGDNTQPQRVNWLRDRSPNGNHGRLTNGFTLKGKTSNWVEADIQQDANDNQFELRGTSDRLDTVTPEPGLLLQLPKSYYVETHPKQAKQETTKKFEKDDWEEIAGLYLLVNVQPKDVLVVTINARRLHNTSSDSGVAVAVAIDGKVDNRSGIYHESNRMGANEQIERGGLSLQYVYMVPDNISGLLAVRGMFAAYNNGTAVIDTQTPTNPGGKSTLHVMAYSQRPDSGT